MSNIITNFNGKKIATKFIVAIFFLKIGYAIGSSSPDIIYSCTRIRIFSLVFIEKIRRSPRISMERLQCVGS